MISGNNGTGAYLTGGSSGNLFDGNVIGTNPTGTIRLGNTGAGIVLENSPGNTIGAAGVLGSNVISGNATNGISLLGAASTGNWIQSNVIGLDMSGMRSIGNGYDGIFLDDAPGNMIGGPARERERHRGQRLDQHPAFRLGRDPEPRSGQQDRHRRHRHSGDRRGRPWRSHAGGRVSQRGAVQHDRRHRGRRGQHHLGAPGWCRAVRGARQNVVQGNTIGLGATGELVPNEIGVFVWDAPNNLIGGPTDTAVNVISGNAVFGVRLLGNSAAGTMIENNRIGTDRSGTTRRPNGYDGVFIQAPGIQVVDNVISANGSSGLQLNGPLATGNVVRNNRIGTDAAGLAPLGNVQVGVFVNEAPGNQLVNNLISANGSSGVQIFGPNAAGNTLATNQIGTNVSGQIVPGLGNPVGLFVNTRAANNYINNTIRGNTTLNVFVATITVPPRITVQPTGTTGTTNVVAVPQGPLGRVRRASPSRR